MRLKKKSRFIFTKFLNIKIKFFQSSNLKNNFFLLKLIECEKILIKINYTKRKIYLNCKKKISIIEIKRVSKIN
jgi:hypothetical protein